VERDLVELVRQAALHPLPAQAFQPVSCPSRMPASGKPECVMRTSVAPSRWVKLTVISVSILGMPSPCHCQL